MKPLTDQQKRAAAQAFLKWAVVKAVELQKQKQNPPKPQLKWRVRKGLASERWFVYRPMGDPLGTFPSWHDACAAIREELA